MVVVKIGDGMGNQLYNYACGYAVARHDHDTLMLGTSECDNSSLRDFELDKFHLKYDKRESFPNRNLFQKLFKRLRRNIKYRVILERDSHLDKDGQYGVSEIDHRVYEKKKIRNKYLYGYWQNLGYFEEYLDEILEMMTPAYEQTEDVKVLIKQLQSTPSCALHVRDGDVSGTGSSSTYSIWAAYLNPNPDKLVILPQSIANKQRKMENWKIFD